MDPTISPQPVQNEIPTVQPDPLSQPVIQQPVTQQPPISQQPVNNITPSGIKWKLIFLIVILLVIVGGGAYYLGAKKNNSVIKTAKKITTNPTVVKSPTISTSSQISKAITYKDHYGEYEIKVPEKLQATSCPGEGSAVECVIMIPAVDKITADYPVIMVNATIPQAKDVLNNLNFNIPALGAGLNAFLEKSTTKETISFLNRGVFYSFENTYDQASKLNYSIDKLDQILKDTAMSITFLDEPSTCKDPALLPLTNFPDNFTLSNYHDSNDASTPTSSWPYATTHHFNNSDYKYLDLSATPRAFMVTYGKSGTSFNSSPDFLNTVTPVNSVKTPGEGGFDQDGTDLWHVNCISTEEDGPGITQPFHIGHDISDPFAVNLYGSAVNPSQLWGISKWNVDLLKAKRNEIYIKQGNLWQKYSALQYFVTMPAAYGGKPAIYLYPTKPTTIKIEIHPRGNLLKTDSLYNQKINGWLVNANPNGIINNSVNYLYYEALLPVPAPSQGYVVSYRDLFNFSKSYVQKLGLNEAESNEFIKFWQQKLPYSPYYFVSHLDINTINKIYPLKITPAPDNLLRVELYFKPLMQTQPAEEPSYPTVNPRKGFTAVEWGGILDN